MTNKIILLFILSISLNADIIDFYKKTVNTLQYNKRYALSTEANKLSQSGITYSKYANFSFNADYSKTKAQTLANTFDTTNITFNDTIDLFGKSSYKIDALALDLQSKKSMLNIQKEQLFISLVNMITLYNKTLQQLSLYKTFLNEQEKIYEKLQRLEQKGAITSMDLLRFKNQLTSLEIKTMNQENEILKMKKQLHLYAPNQQIPTLQESKLLYSKEDFLRKNPKLTLNTLEAQKSLTQAKGLERSYLPDITAGVAYQKLGDPTSYGNNHSFIIGLQIPLNAGKFKETQALKVNALRLKSQNTAYKIQRENKYITIYQDYVNATQQLKILHKSLHDYEESQKSIKTAYLRQYVDFNTYTQVLMQTLHVKEKIIAIKSKKILEATLLNNIASGSIYE